LGPQNGELIGDLKLTPLEAVDRGRTPAGRAGLASVSHRDEQPPAHEHTLEIRRRDVVTERGAVMVAQL
jgi:hypothetical protein